MLRGAESSVSESLLGDITLLRLVERVEVGVRAPENVLIGNVLQAVVDDHRMRRQPMVGIIGSSSAKKAKYALPSRAASAVPVAACLNACQRSLERLDLTRRLHAALGAGDEPEAPLPAPVVGAAAFERELVPGAAPEQRGAAQVPRRDGRLVGVEALALQGAVDQLAGAFDADLAPVVGDQLADRLLRPLQDADLDHQVEPLAVVGTPPEPVAVALVEPDGVEQPVGAVRDAGQVVVVPGLVEELHGVQGRRRVRVAEAEEHDLVHLLALQGHRQGDAESRLLNSAFSNGSG